MLKNAYIQDFQNIQEDSSQTITNDSILQSIVAFFITTAWHSNWINILIKWNYFGLDTFRLKYSRVHVSSQITAVNKTVNVM